MGKSPRGPATVIEEQVFLCHWETGKVKNCIDAKARRPAHLISRFTYEELGNKRIFWLL